MDPHLHNELLVERYKFILLQKQSLNRTTFQVVSIFQGGLGLILSAQYVLCVSIVEKTIGLAWGVLALRGLRWMLLVLALFSVLLIVSGVAAWIGYRKDEAEIEARFLTEPRPLPSVADALRWYETYVVLSIVAVSLSYFAYFEHLSRLLLLLHR